MEKTAKETTGFGEIVMPNDKTNPPDDWPFCEKCKQPVEHVERQFDGGRLVLLRVRCHGETWEAVPQSTIPASQESKP